SVGFRSQEFASAEAFLASGEARATACLILDVRMPGMNGLELQRRLIAADWQLPIIFITSHADDAARAHALEAGAVAFLLKPCRHQELFAAVTAAPVSRGPATTLTPTPTTWPRWSRRSICATPSMWAIRPAAVKSRATSRATEPNVSRRPFSSARFPR